VRCLDNALEVDTAGTKITADNGVTQIPNNGRIIRNLIHGADTVMSHILHFYVLSAPDFVDASPLGSPWSPTYSGTGVILVPATHVMLNNQSVLQNYLDSLVMRRKAHTMGAILSGRQPIQNAIVPGGVTTMPTACDVAKFSDLLNDVRGFINTAYIPDVVYVATRSTTFGYDTYWGTGTNPGNLLSYGEYPIQSGTAAEKLLIKRGVLAGTSPISSSTSWTPIQMAANIVEYTGYSYYSSPSGLNPSVGATTADITKVNDQTHYSWLKAPRIKIGATNYVCEVGPLPRMVASYVVNDTSVTVSGANASQPFNNALIPGLNGVYDVKTLVDGAIGLVSTLLTGTSTSLTPTVLLSTLGRHACRALECKFVADAMADSGAGTQQKWLAELSANLSAPTYVYAKLPSRIKTGFGLAEAPRGALGHWITIENKKIVNYQCVVPTTWNHSPKDDAGNIGPAESNVVGADLTNGGYPATPNADFAVLSVIRLIHPFDFCIACAVHIVTPDNKTISKFNVGLDGTVTKLPVDAEI